MKTLLRHQTALALFTLVLSLCLRMPATADSFTNTGSMNIARSDHTATLLANGKVLVAGGNSVNPSSAELYDPVSRTWVITDSLNFARVGHTATGLSDGRVLIVAGDGNTSSSAEIYSPETGTWTITGVLNVARTHFTATLLENGKILVVGGSPPEDVFAYLTSAEIYDPLTGIWTVTGSLNTPRRDHSATLLDNGKVLVAGGYSGGHLESAELYDPTTGTWAATDPLTNGRVGHTATLLANGNVLVIGDRTAVSSVEVYRPVSGTWALDGALKTRRNYPTTTLLANGKLLVAGGVSDTQGLLSSFEVYDPLSHASLSSGFMNSERYDHTATPLVDGSVLIAGGSGFSGALASAELFAAGIYITAQPQSQLGYWGQSVTLSITATTGVPPLTYQWLKDDVEIDGATSSQLAFSSLQTTDTGVYKVVVTDANNNTLTSQAANLTVNPAGVGIATYAGLTIEGVTGQTYGIQATTDLGNANGWVNIANFTLTQPVQIWYDSQSTAEQQKRFYRVVAGPISIP